MSVSKSLRFQVLRRDNHTCRYCGRTAPEYPLRVDHVVPQALGGTDTPSNLVAACHDCNAGKAATPADAAVIADVDQDAIRWAAAMERAMQMQAQDRAARDAFHESFELAWNDWNPAPPLEENWRRSIDTFRNQGMSADDFNEAISVAMRSPRVPLEGVWRYFCGVCWRILEQRREIAAGLIREEEGR